MNVKKSLENRIRGWLPKEPVLNAPFKAQIVPVDRSLSFKVRRWLHGTSAFISSLIGQINLRTKILMLAFGIGIFTIWFLYSLTMNNLISGFALLWGGRLVDYSVFLFVVVYYSYDYFKKRASHKNLLSENINPNLRLGGIIIGVIGGAILVCSYLLRLFVDSTPQVPATAPFYLDIAALLMLLFGFGLDMEWRKRNKLSPFNST